MIFEVTAAAGGASASGKLVRSLAAAIAAGIIQRYLWREVYGLISHSGATEAGSGVGTD